MNVTEDEFVGFCVARASQGSYDDPGNAAVLHAYWAALPPNDRERALLDIESAGFHGADEGEPIDGHVVPLGRRARSVHYREHNRGARILTPHGVRSSREGTRPFQGLALKMSPTFI
jgi:hypothetical protein